MPKLPKAERPRPTRREAAYFENDELPRLFVAIGGEGVYRLLFETALKTGMRLPRLSWTCCRRSGEIGLRALAVRTAVGMTFVPGARLAASLVIAVRVAARHSTR